MVGRREINGSINTTKARRNEIELLNSSLGEKILQKSWETVTNSHTKITTVPHVPPTTSLYAYTIYIVDTSLQLYKKSFIMCNISLLLYSCYHSYNYICYFHFFNQYYYSNHRHHHYHYKYISIVYCF